MATVQDYLKNDEWVKRIDGIFSAHDVNKDGYVSAEDWMITVDIFEKDASDRPEAIAKLREATLEFTTALGLTEGVKTDKKKFRELGGGRKDEKRRNGSVRKVYHSTVRFC